jgi:hypothetical protein
MKRIVTSQIIELLIFEVKEEINMLKLITQEAEKIERTIASTKFQESPRLVNTVNARKYSIRNPTTNRKINMSAKYFARRKDPQLTGP